MPSGFIAPNVSDTNTHVMLIVKMSCDTRFDNYVVLFVSCDSYFRIHVKQ